MPAVILLARPRLAFHPACEQSASDNPATGPSSGYSEHRPLGHRNKGTVREWGLRNVRYPEWAFCGVFWFIEHSTAAWRRQESLAGRRVGTTPGQRHTVSRRLSCRAGWRAEQLQTSELQRGGSRHEGAHLQGTGSTLVVQTVTEIKRSRRPVREHRRAALAVGLEAPLDGATLTTGRLSTGAPRSGPWSSSSPDTSRRC